MAVLMWLKPDAHEQEGELVECLVREVQAITHYDFEVAAVYDIGGMVYRRTTDGLILAVLYGHMRDSPIHTILLREIKSRWFTVVYVEEVAENSIPRL